MSAETERSLDDMYRAIHVWQSVSLWTTLFCSIIFTGVGVGAAFLYRDQRKALIIPILGAILGGTLGFFVGSLTGVLVGALVEVSGSATSARTTITVSFFLSLILVFFHLGPRTSNATTIFL
mmetsp:Transcript_33549/g.78620  ORF Transcript_33549/g.78620 Transcript_33549/m.78620 type:complete len:122 (+) Transcript_33549:7-372(+)